MAKKIKANKTVSTVLKFVDLAAIVLALVAIFMAFAPALVEVDPEGLGIDSYNGWAAVFGYSETNGNVTTNYLNFSFMNLLTYILLVAGIVLLVLNCFGKGVKFLYFICAGLFVVAAVFFFCTVGFSVSAVGTLFNSTFNVVDFTDYALGAGPIVSAICSIVAAVGCVAKIIFQD